MTASAHAYDLLTHSTGNLVIFVGAVLVALGVIYKTILRPIAQLLRTALAVHNLLLGGDRDPPLPRRLDSIDKEIAKANTTLETVAPLSVKVREIGEDVKELDRRLGRVEGSIEVIRDADRHGITGLLSAAEKKLHRRDNGATQPARDREESQ